MKKGNRDTDQLKKQLLDVYTTVVKRAAASLQQDEGGLEKSAGRAGRWRNMKMAARATRDRLARCISQVLASVTGYWSPVQVDGKEFMRSYVRRTLASSERAALLTRRLIALNRNQLVRPRPVVIHEILRRAESR